MSADAKALVLSLRDDLRVLSDLREWLRNGNAYMEHPDGQDGTDRAVDALDRTMSGLAALVDARPLSTPEDPQ